MSKLDDVVQEIKTKRDELQVRMHLASKEARQEWERLEAKWEEFSSQARIEESARGISSALGLLKDELVRGYERLKKAL